MMHTWPSWHDGKLVTAEHMLGLERFLLMRAEIIEEIPFSGVEYFDLHKSITVAHSEEQIGITVAHMTGVAVGGAPVSLRGGEDLTIFLARPPHEQHLKADLWVEVNKRKSEEAFPPKLTLHGEFVENGVENAVVSKEKEGALFLGRFWLPTEPDGKPSFLKRPRIRRLSALSEFPTEDEWVSPFRTQVEIGLREARKMTNSDLFPHVILTSELARLAFDWPSIPLPTLIRRCCYIQWLNKWVVNAHLYPDPPTSSTLQQLLLTETEQLPQELRMLITPIKAREFQMVNGGVDDLDGKDVKYLLPESTNTAIEIRFKRDFAQGEFQLRLLNKTDGSPMLNKAKGTPKKERLMFNADKRDIMWIRWEEPSTNLEPGGYAISDESGELTPPPEKGEVWKIYLVDSELTHRLFYREIPDVHQTR